MQEGSESYFPLRLTLEQFVGSGGMHELLKEVVIPAFTDSEADVTVRIDWHLCSDLELLLIVLGYKSSGNYKCFQCMHHKNNGVGVASEPRTPESEAHLRVTAEAFVL